MALTKDSTGYYLEPTTGQYYEQAPVPVQTYNPYGYMGMGGWNSQPMFGMGAMGGLGQSNEPAIAYLTQDGMRYKPFTGNAAGISQGKRSVVDAIIGNRQPYNYNVPSLASLFPSMQGNTMPAMMPQGNSGAGRFMGGLLGSMPTPDSTTTTQAPSTSGAGRFL